MKTARMNVICTTVMLVYCRKLAWMSELVHFALSQAEFGVICSLDQTKKTAKARRNVLKTQTGNCFDLRFIRIYMIVTPLKDRN